eukprot:2036165-Pyramimonas_sp.AAC.1
MWAIDWPKYYESIPLDFLRAKLLEVGVPACWLKHESRGSVRSGSVRCATGSVRPVPARVANRFGSTGS